MLKHKGLVEEILHLQSYLKNLDNKVDAFNRHKQHNVFFSIHLPTLILRNEKLATKLGFTTREQLQKEHPNQDPIKQITLQIAVQMGLIRSFKITLEPQDHAKPHPKLKNKYNATSYYSLNIPLMGLMESFQNLIVDVPLDPPGTSVKYKILKATETRAKKNIAIV